MIKYGEYQRYKARRRERATRAAWWLLVGLCLGAAIGISVAISHG